MTFETNLYFSKFSFLFLVYEFLLLPYSFTALKSMVLGTSQQCVLFEKGTFWKILRKQVKLYCPTSTESKYGAFCMNTKVRVHKFI